MGPAGTREGGADERKNVAKIVGMPLEYQPSREQGKEDSMNEEDGAARVFWLKEGEGNARWWGGGLATIKATGK